MTTVWPFSSKRDKDRLYVALYARGGPGYHWSFITGPKPEKESPFSQGMRIHAVQRAAINQSGTPVPTTPGNPINWEFEARQIRMAPTAMVLVRVVIAKIHDMDRLMEILSNVPIRGHDKTFSCRMWMIDAVNALAQDDGQALSAKSKITDWDTIYQAAIEFVEKKKAEHRFDGRDAENPNPVFRKERIATFDLLTGEEIFA
ncbi:hypothetical protein V8F33_002351 [Rhypophila sp. PSN 637]